MVKNEALVTNCILFHLWRKIRPPGVFWTLRVPFPRHEHMKYSAFCWYFSKTGAWRLAFPCIKNCSTKIMLCTNSNSFEPQFIPPPTTNNKASFVCWKVVFFWKVNSGKVNSGKVYYFLMFGSVMENKLENTFQCLVMLWKRNWKIIY